MEPTALQKAAFSLERNRLLWREAFGVRRLAGAFPLSAHSWRARDCPQPSAFSLYPLRPSVPAGWFIRLPKSAGKPAHSKRFATSKALTPVTLRVFSSLSTSVDLRPGAAEALPKEPANRVELRR